MTGKDNIRIISLSTLAGIKILLQLRIFNCDETLYPPIKKITKRKMKIYKMEKARKEVLASEREHAR